MNKSESQLKFARAVSQRIVQEALNQFAEFYKDGGVEVGSDTYRMRVVVAVDALAATLGVMIGAVSANGENLAQGIKSAGERMLAQACQELSVRTGSLITMQKPAQSEQDQEHAAVARELLSAAQHAANALTTAAKIMDAVPRTLHLHADQQIARVGVLTHELGGFSQVENAVDALLAALAFAEQGRRNAIEKAGG